MAELEQAEARARAAAQRVGVEAASAMVRDGSLARILHDLPDLPALWTPA